MALAAYYGDKVAVIASAAKQSIAQRRTCRATLLVVYLVLRTTRRYASRNDGS